MGIVATVGGAMMMTLLKGPMLPWTKGGANQDSSCASDNHNFFKGAFMILIGCICWSAYINVQVITLQSNRADFSLTVWICLFGKMEGTVLTLVLERHNPTARSIHLDSKFLAAVYSSNMLRAWLLRPRLIMKEKGPVFVSAFSPLSIVIVAIMGSIVLAETIYVGM